MPTAAAITFGCKDSMSPLVFFPFCAALAALLLPACSRVEPNAPRGPGPATRVIPASATAVDFVHALIEPQRVAAVPSQALEYSTIHDEPLAWSGVARFDAYLAEQVLALHPDLVLVDPWQAPETTARLREFGVRVVLLPEIATWEQARAALLGLARELQAEDRARPLLAELDRRVSGLRERALKRPPLRVLCYSNFGGAGSTAGANTTLDSVCRMLGLTNVIAERGQRGHVGLTFEDLLQLDPDLVLVSRPLKMAAGAAGDRGGASERLLYSEPALANLRAVREKRIVALPAWLFATGSHELVSAAEALERELEPLLATLEARSR